MIGDMSENDLNTRYECEAMNQLGVNRWEIELVAQSRPDRPSDLRSTHVDFMSASLTWSAGFDGGLDQTFYMDVNDSIVDLSQHASSKSSHRIQRMSDTSINLTGLMHDSVYAVRLMSRNRLGDSEWTDYVMIRTPDLTESDAEIWLPHFESLFLNVPKNRIEFETRPATTKKKPNSSNLVPICLKLTSVMLDSKSVYESNKCLPLDYDESTGNYVQQYQLDDKLTLVKSGSGASGNIHDEIIFNSKLIKSMKVTVCFMAKPSICARKATSAIIGENFPIIVVA